ncbi:MAG: hypothetical protein QXI38_00795 [Conexivisphaerales archaeon]
MPWHDYKEALVEREITILDFQEGGATGDEQRQQGRSVCPDSYIKFLSYLKVGLDIYRESPSHSLNTLKFMQEIHFTQIRMLSMVKKLITATNDKE